MKRFALLALLPLLVTAAERRHLRYDNIHDWEVTEIRQKMAELAPGAVVDIDSVYEGCSCQEGAGCSAQVWVVSHREGLDTGLWLSQIGKHWVLGPWEKWQQDMRELNGHRNELIGPWDAPDYRERRDNYFKRLTALQAAKPVCETATAASN